MPRTRPIATRFLAHRLWSSAPHQTIAEAVAMQKRSYDRSIVIVRVYYALSFLWAVNVVGSWPGYADLQQAEPLWPAHWWFDWVGVRTGVNMIFGAHLVASLLAALMPERRVARAAYAFALLQYMAFVNNADKINHNFHAWLFVSVVLVLLPRGPWGDRRRIADRQYFLTVIWTAQLVVLFTYTLTGAWKVHTAAIDIVNGRTSGIHFAGFSLIVAERLTQYGQETVLGDFFVHNLIPGWALFCGTIYLETCSIVIAFRPRIQRLWGVGLVSFHLGTQLAMGFTFIHNIALVGLLFVCSPYAPDRTSIKDALVDLPVIHFAARRFSRRRASSSSTTTTTTSPAH